jgi:hypothetical protein
MKATPAHYAYSRAYGRIALPWVTGGVVLIGLGLLWMHSALLPVWLQHASALLTILGAGMAWIGVWLGMRWRKAHPFEGPQA